MQVSILLLCNLSTVNNDLKKKLNISPKGFIFLNIFNSKFSYIKVWFTAENSKLLQIEDKINITLIIYWHVTDKNESLFN